MLRLTLIFALVMNTTGCLFPRTTIRKNPGPRDRGVRYYRPKPYLMVQPMVDKQGLLEDGFVSLKIEMLPDFSEEYSIHVRPGLGLNDTEITLTQGWNLTGLNIDVDSNVDDNLSAVADVIRSIPTGTAKDIYGNDSDNRMYVRATNVPLGLYESVIASGPDGRKQLYGFRYVGFMPYAPCPTTSCGMDSQHCAEGPIYGLTFEDGAMVFRPLHELPEHVALNRIEPGEASQDGNSTGAGHTPDSDPTRDPVILEDDEVAPPLEDFLPSPASVHHESHHQAP